MLPCNVIAGFIATVVSFVLAYQDLKGLSAREAAFILTDGLLVLPISFTLLTIGPGMITAPEVSLYTLIETVLGPVWVWLAGFEAPPDFAVYGGAALIFTLAIHSYLGLREDYLKKLIPSSEVSSTEVDDVELAVEGKALEVSEASVVDSSDRRCRDGIIDYEIGD